MSITPFNPDEYDALREIVNIAMGQATTALSTILMNAFVRLSIPQVTIIPVDQMPEVVSGMIGKAESISAVRQAFYDHLNGEVIVIYGLGGCRNMADLMGYDEQMDEEKDQELLLDVSNILVGACLNGIAQQLDMELGYSAPSIIGEKIPVENLFSDYDLTWSHALLVNVRAWIEERKFSSHILIFMEEQSTELVRKALDRLLEGL